MNHIKKLAYLIVAAFFMQACHEKQVPKQTTFLERPVQDTIFLDVPVSASYVDSVRKHHPEELSPLAQALDSGVGEFVSNLFLIEKPLLPLGWVTDGAGIFSAAQIHTLDSLLSKYQLRTGNEIAVFVIDSVPASVRGFNDLLYGIHHSWRLGENEHKNGTVYGICLKPLRVQIIDGYGLDKAAIDSQAKEVLGAEVLQQYGQGELYEATWAGLRRLTGSTQ